MRTILHLSFAYIRHYKRQTGALFLGILLSAALLTGVGSLFASGKKAALENARTEYGDWHYELPCGAPWFSSFTENPKGEGFQVESWGVETIKKAVPQPFEIRFVWGDETYLKMMGRTLIQGHYPEEENEIAMDSHALLNLGIKGTLGSRVELDGETFILCGILSEMPERLGELMGDAMQVFVSSRLDYGTDESFLYLKFKESRPIYRQLKAFISQYEIQESVDQNSGLSGYVGGDTGSLTPAEIWNALKEPEYGLPTSGECSMRTRL